ncbi:Calcium binding isoform A [Micractinium conductrix]|uniref:Calcium binding isoform A n=1 Tax=Micractinium conductrix TaxID=554055 RepID=A0A2P6VI01_9CHLO|nr:Calcium binding isoform A [Micractinium conductrix]|eukprot:PSC73711.1 Calcium binding isoform A [Micractinium conductrix]
MRRAALLLAMCLLAGAARADNNDADDRLGAGWAVACGTSGAPGSWQPLANASAISGDILEATLKDVEREYGANISSWLGSQSWSCVLGDNLNIAAAGCSKVVAGTEYILQVNLTCALNGSDYTLGVFTEAFQPLPTANKTAIRIYDMDVAFLAKDGVVIDGDFADNDGPGRWKWDSVNGDWVSDADYVDDQYTDNDGDGVRDDYKDDGIFDDGKAGNLTDNDGDGLANDIVGDRDGDGYRDFDDQFSGNDTDDDNDNKQASAMARSTLLALCLCCALAFAAAQPEVAPASNCGGTTGLGGWKPTAEVPPPVYEAVVLQLTETSSNSTWQPCDDPAPTLIAACSQVVAGMNYQIVASFDCPDISSNVEVEAEVYVPLAYTNAEPEVTDLQINSVDGKPSPPLPDADEGVDSFCNPANSNYTTKPLPCTQQQEADALAQLAEDSASPGDFAVLADNSTCNATDAYSEPVDLMDPDLLEVVWEVASEYAQQSEFWQAACQGDLMSDAYNACRQPDDGNGTTEGTHYQVQMKLGCALGSDDTIALQAEAWLLKDADGGNVTVSEVEWVEIPLPTDPTQ